VNLRDLGNWWHIVPGACWRLPEGPGSSVSGREYHPVVHVCWEDIRAYATWANQDLPTEAEWELAARGGLEGAMYAWGDQFMLRGRLMANVWMGQFPWKNVKPVRGQQAMRVRSFPPNGYGLFDMTGNVWE
jgi:formylglycine-generating enzyme required for sulfatase activity